MAAVAATTKTVHQALQAWKERRGRGGAGGGEGTDNQSVIDGTRALAAAAGTLVTAATSPGGRVCEDDVEEVVDATLLFLDLTAEKELYCVYPRPVITAVRYVVKILNAVHNGRVAGLGRAAVKLSHSLLAVIAFVELLDSAGAGTR